MISNRTRKSSSNQRRSRLKLYPGGGETALMRSPFGPFEYAKRIPMIVLEMADHGLDGSSASHLAANDFCDAADLAANPDPEPVGIVVAAIALVAVDAADSSTLLSFSRSVMTGPSVWPSYGLPCSALACSTNCPPLGAVAGVAIDTLQPNSYGVRALPATDALHLGGVP